MKKINQLKLSLIFLLFTVVVSACTSSSTEENKEEPAATQDKAEEPKVNEQKDPLAIATELQKAIDAKLEQLKVKEHEGEEGPAMIKIKFYHEGEQIHKIEYTVGADHGSIVEKYYFEENGTLVFAQIEQATWSFDPEKEGETIDFVDSYKFYFDGNKTIKASGKSVTANSKVLEEEIKKAVDQDLDIAKGAKLIARSTAAKQLFVDGVEDGWTGMDYLDLKEQ